jgi:hypothetical protein
MKNPTTAAIASVPPSASIMVRVFELFAAASSDMGVLRSLFFFVDVDSEPKPFPLEVKTLFEVRVR